MLIGCLEAMADLPQELSGELDKLDKEFWVGPQKLKDITDRFVEELNEGLEEDGRNIVGPHSLFAIIG